MCVGMNGLGGWRGQEGGEDTPDRGDRGPGAQQRGRMSWSHGPWVSATCTQGKVHGTQPGGERLGCSFSQARDSPCFPAVSLRKAKMIEK